MVYKKQIQFPSAFNLCIIKKILTWKSSYRYRCVKIGAQKKDCWDKINKILPGLKCKIRNIKIFYILLKNIAEFSLLLQWTIR